MTVPDITNLTIKELGQLAQAIHARVQELTDAAEVEREAAKVEIKAARARLDALIGPDNPTTPSLNSYTEFDRFTDQQIQDHLVIAIRTLRTGAELQARIMRDIVTILAITTE